VTTNLTFDTIVKRPVWNSKNVVVAWYETDLDRARRHTHVPQYALAPFGTITLYANRVECKMPGRAPERALLVKRSSVSLCMSRKSRRRLMNAFNAWSIPEGYKRYHITLTYPAVFPLDWRRWKLDLKEFKRKLLALMPEAQGYWRLEFQKRGAPHFHLLIVAPKGMVTNKALKKYVTRTWAKIAHSDDIHEGKCATRVDVLHTETMLTKYLTKYAAKPGINPVTLDGEYLDDGSIPNATSGRHWGRVGKPNEAPYAAVSAHIGYMSEFRHIISKVLINMGQDYGIALDERSIRQSWQVYGIKALAILYCWDALPLSDDWVQVITPYSPI